MNKATEYLFDYQFLADLFEDAKSSFESKEKNAGLKFEDELPKFTLKFLQEDPLNYLLFGVYWWPIKKVLREQGLIPKSMLYVDSPIIEDAYTVKDEEGNSMPYGAFIAGYKMKDYCRSKYFFGNRDFFPFGEDQDVYTLVDEEWEKSIYFIH